MPAALPINWDVCKMLYAQGLSSREIAERANVSPTCVRSRIAREKWRDNVALASAEVSHAAVGLARTGLKQRADAFIETMSNDVDDTLVKVRKQPIPKSMPKLLERESVLEKLNKRARLTYGLDSDASSRVSAGAVNVQVNISTASSSEAVKIEPEC